MSPAVMAALGAGAPLVACGAAVWLDGRIAWAVSAVLAIAVGWACALGTRRFRHQTATGADEGGSVEDLRRRVAEADAFQDVVAQHRAKRDQALRQRDKLLAAFELKARRTLGLVGETMTEVQDMASRLRHDAGDTCHRAGTVSKAVDEATANVEGVASAAEKLAASVAEISRRVTETTATAQEARDTVARTRQTMQELADAARQVGDIVGLINEIADQTNLLALNATIEAARAGDAGKGFAVVAGEVKSLATQTGQATSDISHRIEAIQRSTDEAGRALRDVDDVVGRVSEVIASIAVSAEEQTAATGEISHNAQKAAQVNRVVAGHIGQMADVARDADAGAGQLAGAATNLTGETTTLREHVQAFLEDMKVADISGRVVLLAASVMDRSQVARAEAALTERTGLTLADVTPESWVNTSVFDAFLQEYASGSGRGGQAIIDLGRKIFPALDAAGTLPKGARTPAEWLAYEAQTFKATHRGNEVRQRNVLRQEDGYVVIEAQAPGYDPSMNLGLFEGILMWAGVRDFSVTRRSGDIFDITWTP